ncbi:MAG TPA: tetratricopeptide repeat protein [Thermoanaerobaculia bacterium]|nr:tetratricopeptide repeat protein [Thermoanaerobaculia bacterium]
MGADDGVPSGKKTVYIAVKRIRSYIIAWPSRELPGAQKMQIHPSDSLLRETFQDLASRSGHPLRDHLDRCSRCRKRLRALLSAYWAGRPLDYDTALDRSFGFVQNWQRIYAKERAEAQGLFSALQSHPAGRQQLLLRNHPRFQTWGLFDLLLRQSHEQVFLDTEKSEEWARLALVLSYYLDAAVYGMERIEDLRARAWAFMGNARRVRNDLAGADQAFETAFLHLRKGTGEILERAVLLHLKASLRRLQRRFDEARQLLQRTIAVFKETGEQHYTSRSLVTMSVLLHVQGEPEKAIFLLKEAIPMVDAALEPRALFCAWHNLVDDLASTGRFMEARGLLAKVRPLYRQFPEPWAQSRMKWVEAKISRGLGHYQEARVLLQEAHGGLLAAKLPHDAALVSSEILTLPVR